MDQIDQLIENVRTFCAVLEKLRLMEGPEMLLPGRVEMYNRTLEDAYTAYAQVETAVDEWGQELEYQHMRLDEGVKQYGQTEQDRNG
jgi:prefoldin subunit 5